MANPISPPNTNQSSQHPEDSRYLITALEDALLAVNRPDARRIVKDSCSVTSPISCLETLIIPTLDEIGKRWERGEVALSQVYMSGRFCEEIVDQMLPKGHSDRKNQPKIAVVVLEDHHSLGKRILYSVLRASGFEVIDYGIGISVETLVENVTRDKIQILLISTLMLPAALRTKDAIKQIKDRQPQTKVIVGGAPFRFDTELWREVQADAMGHTATDTIEIINTLVEEMA
ncbi:MAG TPA: cobalamin-dependent protein [Methanospirillum sp.]|nr:cobalamin-dependent protein [Methanospirillum sp.]